VYAEPYLAALAHVVRDGRTELGETPEQTMREVD
jgi:hypothetical protein